MVATALPRRMSPPARQAEVSHVVAPDGRRIPFDSLERLEQLDDTVFAALSGDPAALETVRAAWREASGSVDAALLNETRQHYIDRAQSRWRRSQQSPSDRLTLGFAALEVLAMLDG
ncbi:hypothetical protein Pla108_16490 [Botrimarina colliarenosi]|uniref:Uncharacterized protein n=1 Tax=Botrimarina colliarenosi TaxID=2528001 RepID=A0A5C6AMJ0_9BACT|nr:hypothetical protein [Botrimarina colliarenosi]TWU00697.1 hypothetical protein Pla108_16490 [Botrimarina colliarenosi]